MATATDEEINDVREVAGENDNNFIGTLIDSLNDAQWEWALALVDAWRLIAPGDLMALEGGRDGLRISDQEGLDDIRKRMRLLLGLPELRSVGITGLGASQAIGTRWIY